MVGMASSPPKPYYSESEAARALGLSVEEFRGLLKRHIIDSDADLSNASRTTFHASDVLLLRLLATRALGSPGRPTPTMQG
jgi:hypothetical protein